MTARIVSLALDADLTAAYACIVWIGVMLSVVWTILMSDDPANAGLPKWDLRLRRIGVITMAFGFILSVLFGGDQGWAPWPTMLIIAFGFDFYMAAAIMTSHRRTEIRKMRERMAGIATDHRPIWN